MRNTFRRILVLGAMKCETETLISLLENKTEYTSGDFYFADGTICGKALTVGCCLVGSTRSAAAAMLAIHKYAPDCVIICGTAGGHDPALHRGDVVLGAEVINAGRYNAPHRNIGEGSDSLQWSFSESDCFEDGGNISFNVCRGDEALIEAALSVEYSAGKAVCGTVLSSDGWNRELDRIALLHKEYGSSCEDMESFSVYEICRMYALPCLAVRIISNSELYPGEGMNLEVSGRDCQKFVLGLIEKI